MKFYVKRYVKSFCGFYTIVILAKIRVYYQIPFNSTQNKRKTNENDAVRLHFPKNALNLFVFQKTEGKRRNPSAFRYNFVKLLFKVSIPLLDTAM